MGTIALNQNRPSSAKLYMCVGGVGTREGVCLCLCGCVECVNGGQRSAYDVFFFCLLSSFSEFLTESKAALTVVTSWKDSLFPGSGHKMLHLGFCVVLRRELRSLCLCDEPFL